MWIYINKLSTPILVTSVWSNRTSDILSDSNERMQIYMVLEAGEVWISMLLIVYKKHKTPRNQEI